MSKYKFRLEPLQRLRIARRDQCRTALAEAFHAEAVLTEHRATVSAEQTALRELQRAMTTGRNFDVNRMLECQRYELVLKTREQELAQQSALLATETERRRMAVVEADREVRVLELLDERRRQEHRRTEQRQEIKLLDEAAANRRAYQ